MFPLLSRLLYPLYVPSHPSLYIPIPTSRHHHLLLSLVFVGKHQHIFILLPASTVIPAFTCYPIYIMHNSTFVILLLKTALEKAAKLHWDMIW